MSKRKVSVIITDLDNTLYDWFEVWSQSFTAMLDRLVSDSGISRETLITEIKQIHENHGTAEYAFLIQEIPSLQKKHPGENLSEKYAAAITAYQQKRSEHLALYPHALNTLKTLKERGCKIVGYTESQLFYTEYRIRSLGLDGVLDYFYSPPSHDMPANLTAEQSHFYPTHDERLKRTIHRATPKGEMKPNPEVLRGIIEEIGASREQVIYVGDNRTKDIWMAQQADVADVYAAYGDIDKNSPEYQLLRQVTHWKKAAVEKEKDEDSIIPTYTLKDTFLELLTLFDFVPHSAAGGADMSDERVEKYIELWKKTVDVQQHFNDLELRIRNFAITVLGAVLGVIALSLKDKITVDVPRFGQKPLAALLTFIALITWLAFYFMDRFWYHRLLLGAVKHGLKIEKRLETVLPDADLAKSIGDESPIKIGGWQILNSSRKMNLFYLSIAAMLALLLYAFLRYAPPPPPPQNPSPAPATASASTGRDSSGSQ